MGLRVSSGSDSIVHAGATNARYSFYSCPLTPYLRRYLQEHLVPADTLLSDCTSILLECAIHTRTNVVGQVICDTTRTDDLSSATLRYRNLLATFSEQFVPFDQKLLIQLLQANHTSDAVIDCFRLPDGFVTLSPEDEHTIFSNPKINGWDQFHRLHPNSRGLLAVSKIGFNRRCTQAIMYVSHTFCYGIGEGSYYLFRRKSTWFGLHTSRVWQCQGGLVVWTA